MLARHHLPKLFLLLLGAFITLGGTVQMGIKFYHCVYADSCHIMYDFVVAYRPAWALVHDRLSDVYNVEVIERWLASAQGGDFSPTLYPPYSLFLFYPLGLINPPPAAVCWFSAHALLLLAVLCMRPVRILLANTPPLYVVVFFLPFCVRTLLYGQVGMLYTALFLLVIVWRSKRPVLAGLALTLMCFKPHITLALLILLLVEKNRTVILTSITCIALAIIGSLLCWGMTLWLDYAKVSTVSSLIIASALPQYLRIIVSFFMAVRMMGGSVALAQILQAALTLCIAVVLWRALKRCETDSQRLMLLAPATFLLSPYSFIYDTVLLAPVCVILVARILGGVAKPRIYLLLVLLAFIPISGIKLYDLFHFPYVILTIGLSFWVAWADVSLTRKNT